MHLRTATTAALTTALLLVLAVPAGATQPTTQVFEFGGVIQGFVPECGYELRWEIDGTATRTTFFDQDGTVDRFQDRVRETNTITNLTTGESLQEGPDAFLQRILFEDDGSVTVEVNGLSAHVASGVDAVVDAGRVVLSFGPGGPELVALVGRHDIRAIDPFTTSDPALLAGFCAAFA